MKLFRLIFVMLVAATQVPAQTIPSVKAKALDDSEVALPKPGSGQVLILIVGFSKKSGDLSKVWGKKIAMDYGDDGRIAYYDLPILQSAPSFVRPMILHGMRTDLPPNELPHFVPLYSNESVWKKLVNFSAPDDAYLIVATPDGHSVWQAHGPYADDMYAALQKSVAALLHNQVVAHRWLVSVCCEGRARWNPVLVRSISDLSRTSSGSE